MKFGPLIMDSANAFQNWHLEWPTNHEKNPNSVYLEHLANIYHNSYSWKDYKICTSFHVSSEEASAKEGMSKKNSHFVLYKFSMTYRQHQTAPNLQQNAADWQLTPKVPLATCTNLMLTLQYWTTERVWNVLLWKSWNSWKSKSCRKTTKSTHLSQHWSDFSVIDLCSEQPNKIPKVFNRKEQIRYNELVGGSPVLWFDFSCSIF